MIITIAILILAVACLVVLHKAWMTCNLVASVAPQVVQLHAEAIRTECSNMRGVCTESAFALQKINETTKTIWRENLDQHVIALKAISDSHGQAATNLAASIDSFRVAASASADSTVELRQAGDNLKTLLGDSNLFEINQHLTTLRRFFCGKDS